MRNLSDMPLAMFCKELASGSPTPGGGCVAATSGAMAASLASMVARITAASDEFAARAEEMNGIVAETDRLGGELLRLANDDAVAFEQVMMAFRMPKATPEEQVARKQAIEKGYRAAVMPPLLVCEKSLRVLELALCVAKRGTPNAASDAGVAALLAFAAIEAGALNVEINLAAIQDEQFRQTCAHQVQAARVQGRAVHDESVGIVEETLN